MEWSASVVDRVQREVVGLKYAAMRSCSRFVRCRCKNHVPHSLLWWMKYGHGK